MCCLTDWAQHIRRDKRQKLFLVALMFPLTAVCVAERFGYQPERSKDSLAEQVI